MRLICGIFQLDGTEAREEFLRALAAQMDVSHLRPGLRLWQDGPAGLAVLDFSARPGAVRALPEIGASTMAADVRLDEPDALRRAFGSNARDTEDGLLLSVLEQFGPHALDRVLGDFAFASWNRNTQHLTCGRDIFGVRPLAYVYHPGKLFAFASFPKALHGSGIVPKTINEDAVARRIMHAFRSDDCLVAGINRLPPAHFLEVSSRGISLVRYWQLDRAAVGTKKCSPAHAAHELRRLLDEAVRCRLPRMGESGAHLSGGLDSSAIAVLAARKLREEGRALHAYSFLGRQRNDVAVEDETEFVKAVLEQESDINWTPIRPPAGLSVCGTPVDVDQMTLLRDDAPENALCAHAAQQRIGLILSGWGGDEGATFNGIGALAELLLRGRWRTLAREILSLNRERGWSVPRILNGEIISYLRPEGLINFIKRRIGREVDLPTLFRQSLSASVSRRLAASHAERLTMVPNGQENRWRLMNSPHLSRRAEVYAQTGARYGLAFAFPFLDRRVVEFALSLPSELFVRGGFRRRVFRDAMADVLPDRVRWRHQKYQRFPDAALDVAESKRELITSIDTYEQNDSIRRVINLAVLRQHIDAFPSPERLRGQMRKGNDFAPPAAMVAAIDALAVAEYLMQHGDRTSRKTWEEIRTKKEV